MSSDSLSESLARRDAHADRGQTRHARAGHGSDGGNQDGNAAHHRVSDVAAAALSAGKSEGAVVIVRR